MKILADTHVHSVGSAHAYSTVRENAEAAAKKGLSMIALTDHTPAMKGTTVHAYFANLHVLPDTLYGVRLLKGAELNILDASGAVDLEDGLISALDIAIASLHPPCIKPGDIKENTMACINAMENPYIDVLGHPGDPRYPLDFDEIFCAARRTGTLLEVNDASLVPGGLRFGSEDNIKKLLRLSMKNDVPVVVGSDAHFFTKVGDLSHAEALFKEIGFPEELVLNTDPKMVLENLKRNKKEI